ncbi:MAG: hypothetical protein AAB390_04025 [Patescibacteria group bacterium]
MKFPEKTLTKPLKYDSLCINSLVGKHLTTEGEMENDGNCPKDLVLPADARERTDADQLARLNSDQIRRARMARQDSTIMANALRRLIAHFGDRVFTFNEAMNFLKLKRAIVMRVFYSAERNGWMPIKTNKIYRFWLEKIPQEWGGRKNNEHRPEQTPE